MCCVLTRLKQGIEYLYFCSFANARAEIFDWDLFATAVDGSTTVKVYHMHCSRFESLMALTDLVDELKVREEGREEEGVLFASEFVVSAKVLMDDLQLGSLNVSEKYRVKKRRQRVFDYCKEGVDQKEVSYLKLCIKDTVLSCSSPKFYVCSEKEFLLMDTSSEMIRLENKQVLQSGLEGE